VLRKREVRSFGRLGSLLQHLICPQTRFGAGYGSKVGTGPMREISAGPDRLSADIGPVPKAQYVMRPALPLPRPSKPGRVYLLLTF
jgi:hypothetical protein